MVDNSGGSQEVELNLAPIIDCFTVLITYLLVTASFLTLTAVDVSVSATNDSSTPTTPPPVTDEKPLFMTMDLAATGELFLKVSGGDLKTDYKVTVAGKDGVWNKEVLNATLDKIRNRWSKLSEVSLNAAPEVRYKEVVNLINETQKTMPKVYIAGGG